MAAEQWWALSEVNTSNPAKTGPWTYFQATAAQAQARAKLTITYGGEQALYGPYATEADAKTAVASGQDKPQQTGSPNPPSLPNPLSGLAAIGDFFGRLTEGNTWIRIGEALLGIVLIAVGLARVTHAVPVATSIARTVGATGLAIA